MLIPLKGISTGARIPNIEAEGFQGEGCKNATEIFQKALGAVKDETVKAEFYQTEIRQEFINEG